MLKRLLFVVLLALAGAAQAVNYSLPWGPKPQFIDANGAPMSSGTLQTLLAGTSTPQITYTTATGSVSNSTTMTLDTRGETPNEVWLASGVSYKFILKDSGGTTIWTVDNVSGINDVTAQLGQEWVTSGLTPTFVSTTSLTLTGDQTLVFHVGRRLKSTNSGGTVYSTVTASAFGAVTTVTVANDSGTLDSGLSSVSYGVVSANNPSVSPEMVYRKGTAVASAATTNIWGIVGDYVHVTGSVTITSFGTAPYAGAERTVIFDSTPTITHNATTLQLPGGQSFSAAAGDRIVVRADTTANMIVTSHFRASGAQPNSLPRSYLSGGGMANGTDATNDINVAAGEARDSTDAADIRCSALAGKQLDAAWAVGANAGMRDTGVISDTTWHIYWIRKDSDGTCDVLASTSASSPTMPSGYTLKRRIGSIIRASAAILAFTQFGDTFHLTTMVQDSTTTTLSTTASDVALASVPTGVKVFAKIRAYALSNPGANWAVLISSKDESDQAASATGPATMGNGTNNPNFQDLSILANTSATIRTRSSAANTTLTIHTLGWTDFRGRDE